MNLRFAGLKTESARVAHYSAHGGSSLDAAVSRRKSPTVLAAVGASRLLPFRREEFSAECGVRSAELGTRTANAADCVKSLANCRGAERHGSDGDRSRQRAARAINAPLIFLGRMMIGQFLGMEVACG